MSDGLTKEEQAISLIRHDLRSPLTAIQGYSEMILEETQDRSDQTGANLAREINKAGAATLEFIDAYADALLKTGKDRPDAKLWLDKIAGSNESVLRFTAALKSCDLTEDSRKDLGAIAASCKNLCEMISHLRA